MKKPWEGVLKIQKPIFANDEKMIRDCLFYNEGKDIFFIADIARDEIEQIFDKEEYKVYRKAKVDRHGNLSILEKVPQEAW